MFVRFDKKNIGRIFICLFGTQYYVYGGQAQFCISPLRYTCLHNHTLLRVSNTTAKHWSGRELDGICRMSDYIIPELRFCETNRTNGGYRVQYIGLRIVKLSGLETIHIWLILNAVCNSRTVERHHFLPFIICDGIGGWRCVLFSSSLLAKTSK